MTGIAFCRILSGVIKSEKLGEWVLGTSDQRGRGQDKARKVRAVGRDGLRQGIPAIRQTLRSIDHTLRCFGTRYRRSTFDTL
jgi:hypothetical protein